MEDLKIKLAQEAVELDKKITALEAFINKKDTCKALDFPVKVYLRFQKWAMIRYYFWLASRINYIWPALDWEDLVALTTFKADKKAPQKKKSNKKKKSNE